MRISVRVFGLDLLDIDLSTDPTSPGPDDDKARDLSGGTISSDRLGFVPLHRDAEWQQGVER